MPSVSSILKPQSHNENVNTGFSAKYCADVCRDLSGILAATYKLTIKSHLYHWNVVGPLFKPLHELTEEHYNALFAATDVVAERIRALGHMAPNNLADAAKFAPTAAEVQHTSAIEMIKDLITDHEQAVRNMRSAAKAADDANDMVTADMLTAQLAFHEKALWMLRAIIAN